MLGHMEGFTLEHHHPHRAQTHKRTHTHTPEEMALQRVGEASPGDIGGGAAVNAAEGLVLEQSALGGLPLRLVRQDHQRLRVVAAHRRARARLAFN